MSLARPRPASRLASLLRAMGLAGLFVMACIGALVWPGVED